MDSIREILRSNFQSLPSESLPFGVVIGFRSSPYTTLKAWTYISLAAPTIFLFMKLNLSANFASILLMMSGPLALFMSLFGGGWLLTSFIIFFFVNYFDWVDGNVARRTNSVSPGGGVLDAFGATVNASSLIIFLTYVCWKATDSSMWVVVGFVWLWLFLLNQVFSHSAVSLKFWVMSESGAIGIRDQTHLSWYRTLRPLRVLNFDGRSRISDSLLLLAALQITLISFPILALAMLVFLLAAAGSLCVKLWLVARSVE